MTNGLEPDTMASDKERHPVALKLLLMLWRAPGLGLLSIKELVGIINVILFPSRRAMPLPTTEGYSAQTGYRFLECT